MPKKTDHRTALEHIAGCKRCREKVYQQARSEAAAKAGRTKSPAKAKAARRAARIRWDREKRKQQ